jgi:hypothetical protein
MDPTTSLFSAPEESVSEVTQTPAASAQEPALEPALEPAIEVLETPAPAAFEPAPAETAAPEVMPAQTMPTEVMSAESMPESMSDSQIMQTRVRPRDYSSPLRRSSELGGSSNIGSNIGSEPANAPIHIPVPQPTATPLRPQVQVPAPAAPDYNHPPEQLQHKWKSAEVAAPPMVQEIPAQVAQPIEVAPAIEAPAVQTAAFEAAITPVPEVVPVPEPFVAPAVSSSN